MFCYLMCTFNIALTVQFILKQFCFFCSFRRDILSILTEVNYQVAAANANMDGGIYKQVPAPLFTLRKRLYLKPCPYGNSS